MKSILMSIRVEHNRNIESGLKLSELRTTSPKLNPPFKVYTYESGALGRHKIVNEWICSDMEIWRMCMGIPAHLSKNACVSNEHIWKYSKNGYKDITEMKISELVIYDKPKELYEFRKSGALNYDEWLYGMYNGTSEINYEKYLKQFRIKRPPLSWCYVERKED